MKNSYQLSTYIFLLCCLSFTFEAFAGPVETVYLLPGQGSDKRIFNEIALKGDYNVKYLEYDSLVERMTMCELAEKLIEQIDTTESFALVGVSLGGMLCVEMSELVQPEKVIIISSAKSNEELPFRYTFQRYVPVIEIVPASVVAFGAKVLQPLVEPDRNNQKETFKSMLYAKSPTYLKNTARMIVLWERETPPEGIVHIHGTKDHTIPFRNVEASYSITKGSHMMALTRGQEVGALVREELLFSESE